MRYTDGRMSPGELQRLRKLSIARERDPITRIYSIDLKLICEICIPLTESHSLADTSSLSEGIAQLQKQMPMVLKTLGETWAKMKSILNNCVVCEYDSIDKTSMNALNREEFFAYYPFTLAIVKLLELDERNYVTQNVLLKAIQTAYEFDMKDIFEGLMYKITNCSELAGVAHYLSANSAHEYLDTIDRSLNASNISDPAGLFAIASKHNLQQLQSRTIQYARSLVNFPLRDYTLGYSQTVEIAPLAGMHKSSILSTGASKVPTSADSSPIVRPKSVTFSPHIANRLGEQSAGRERA